MAKSTKKKKSPPTEEQQLKRQKASFKRKIRNMFTGAGFTYITTNDKEKQAIAKKAITLLQTHRTVFLDSGSTAP